MGRHAYLIMAHHRPDLFKELLTALDDSRNDIFVHIDQKADIKMFQVDMKYSKIFYIPQMNVIWAHYSQVQCEYELLKAAYKNGPYSYYHLLTGSTFPLKNQNDMHAYFDKFSNTEFIGFDEKEDYSYRVKCYFLFKKMGKPTTLIKNVKWNIRKYFLWLQKTIGFNRLAKESECKDVIVKKGCCYVSVTNDFVKYVLEKEGFIYKLLKESISGDEIFIQTLAYNSNFRKNVYSYEDEYIGCRREFAWDDVYGKRDEHNFIEEDLEYLIQSDKCFALKFEGKDGLKLIKFIKEVKHINEIRENEKQC